MTEHGDERLALIGRPERDFPAGMTAKERGVVGVLGEAGGGAEMRRAIGERNAGGNVDPSESSLLGTARKEVMIGEEFQKSGLGAGSKAVKLHALGIVDVQVFRLGRREHIPIMQKGRCVDALVHVELADQTLL